MDEKKYSLYIVSTPIGNMDDISVRALNALRDADFILCEDTRQSVKLMNHFGLSKPLISYHKFNENETADHIIDRLVSGERACLISDAGTPLISDPGYVLVQKLIENGIEFCVVPGANAVLPSIIKSGFSTEHFLFLGFLPRQKIQRTEALRKFLFYEYPVIMYASPHELRKLLSDMNEVNPKARLALNKELTKLHEETLYGTASELLAQIPESPKGEYTIVADAWTEEEPTISGEEDLGAMFEELTSSGMRSKDALKIMAEKTGINKKELYDMFMKKDE